MSISFPLNEENFPHISPKLFTITVGNCFNIKYLIRLLDIYVVSLVRSLRFVGCMNYCKMFPIAYTAVQTFTRMRKYFVMYILYITHTLVV